MTTFKNVHMSDRQNLSERTITPNGYLRAPANFSRTGIYQYTGAELGVVEEPSRVFNIFRPRDEVFSEDSLATFADLPVTLGHPPEMLNAINTKQYSVGYSGTEVEQLENFVKGELTIFDQHAIDSINKGTSEISLGYICDYEESSGETMGGEHYDLIQRNIRGNHIAIVGNGRAGEKCEIYDSQNPINKGKTMPKKLAGTIKPVTIKGTFTSDADVAELVSNNTEKTKAIKPDTQDLEIKEATIDGEFKGMIDGINERLDKLEQDRGNHGQEDACKEEAEDMPAEEMEDNNELKEKTIDNLEEGYDEKENGGKKMEDKAMQDSVMKLATELVEIREKAKEKFPSIALDGKTPIEIIKEVVTSTFTAENFDSASPDYIRGRFDALPVAETKRESHMLGQLSRATRDSQRSDVSEAQKAFNESKDNYKK